LATVGVKIQEKDYRSTIISCLPPSLANFASSLIAAARVNDPKKEVQPDTLISVVSEEFKRHATHRSNHSKASKTDSQDEALAVNPGKDKFRKPRGVCWNCGEKGHFKDKCDKPLKEKGGSSKKGGAANAAVESDSDSEAEGAFFIEMDFDSDDDGLLPDLQSVSNSSEESDAGDYSDGDDDWFSEVGEDDMGDFDLAPCGGWESEELSGADGSECSSFVSVDLDSERATEEITAHVVAGNDPANSPCAEVYDSGSTRHLSLFREDLENFTKISPKTFRAANKQSFSAVGMGELTVDIPNGANSSQLRLTEVLYSPEVGYTLVSVG
jgi:Zinc knuckle